MAKNILVHINSTDVTSFLKKAVKTETYGYSVASYELEFAQAVNDIVVLSVGLSVEVWLDDNSPPTTKVFFGSIDEFNPDKGFVKVTAKDKLSDLINTEVTHVFDKDVVSDPSYPDGKISDIFIDLVETYGGLSTNGGLTVQDSGTDTVLSKFICNHADPFERCKKLAETLNWVFYYRADTGFVYFEPKNYVENSSVLTVGSNVLEMPQWNYDKSEMINILRLEGAHQVVSTFEVFTGDGSEDTFTLTNIPIDIAVFYGDTTNLATTARTQAMEQSLDIKGGTVGADVEIDRERKKLYFASPPSANTSNVLVEYSFSAPIPVRLKNPSSIVSYGTQEKTVTLTDVDSLDDAWKRAENILAKYSQPWKMAKLKVRWSDSLGVRVGQEIYVSDSVTVPNVAQNFTVYKTVDYWPENIVELEVGDKQFTIDEYQANVLERVKRLEQTMSGTTSAVTEIESASIEFDYVPYQTNVLVEVANDSFLLGDTDLWDNGVLHSTSTADVLSDFEDYTVWTATGGSQTLSDDSTSGHFWVGSQGVNSSWTDASGTAYIEGTVAQKDLSTAFDSTATGSPTRGTIGLWVYLPEGDDVSDITLRVGSDSSNYAVYTAQTFSQRNYIASSFSLVDDARTYVLFDADDPDSTTGTVDWSAIDYVRISWTIASAGNMTFDYLTFNESNKIGLNGLGDRYSTYSNETITW